MHSVTILKLSKTYQISKVIHSQCEAKYVSVGIMLLYVDFIRQPDEVSLQLLQIVCVVPVMKGFPLGPLLLMSKPRFDFPCQCCINVQQHWKQYSDHDCQSIHFKSSLSDHSVAAILCFAFFLLNLTASNNNCKMSIQLASQLDLPKQTGCYVQDVEQLVLSCSQL